MDAQEWKWEFKVYLKMLPEIQIEATL
jgi:hypothetical protein